MKLFTVIVLTISLPIACMDMRGKDETTTYWWRKKDSIDTIDVTNKTGLYNFFKEKNYRDYKRDDLEKLIQKAIKHKIDINSVEENFEPAYLNSLDYGSTDATMIPHKSTLLGYCTCREKYDLNGYVLADILVNNGAKLSGSYNGKFGFYFIKRVLDSFLASCDVKTPSTKLLETLLYRRIQYCAKKSKYLYLIGNRIKNKTLYQISPIPRCILEHIAHLIINDGVLDVINVCNEEFTETYRLFETGNNRTEQWTMLKRWKRLLESKEYVPAWKPELRPFDPKEWDKDFNKFMRKKRNTTWKPGNTNLIVRSLHYKEGSLYHDAEFIERKN